MKHGCVLGVVLLSLIVCGGVEAAAKDWRGVYEVTVNGSRTYLNGHYDHLAQTTTTMKVIPLGGSKVKIIIDGFGSYAPTTVFTGHIGGDRVFATWVEAPDKCRTLWGHLRPNRRMSLVGNYPRVHPGGTCDWVWVQMPAKWKAPLKFNFKKGK